MIKTDDNASKRGPLGDVRPDAVDPHLQKEGALKPEEVDDRPNVGVVKPEDYPEDQRAKGTTK
ncbi:hypothetical protein [Novosphingobium sp. TCA1]|uniref:hypothetical protein n=1 Tax=Novosphingobium sp. TCA1 TaxID=2682474 RepID=UPI0013067137|nr:hypothetical protein [Novosphingobium sp. TCA1]GFE76639.1 hypothetical protein NTCA1_42880 [Novosphingobium sp. TCA1]